MVNRYLRSAFLFLIKRIFWLYFLAFVIVINMVDYRGTLDKIQLTTLNRFRPASFRYLIDVSENRKLYNKKKMEEYTFYFQKVTEYLPTQADAFGLLGFCYYQQGLKDKALRVYKKAIELHPYLFWFYYNAGLIQFQEGHYQEASDLLRKGLDLNQEVSLKYIMMSARVYLPVLITTTEDVPNYILLQLANGYRKAHLLLALSCEHQKNYTDMVNHASLAIRLNLDQKGEFYYLVGVGSYQLKSYENAILFLKKSIERNPYHSESYRYMALCLKEAGRDALANDFQQKADLLKKAEPISMVDERLFTLEVY